MVRRGSDGRLIGGPRGRFRSVLPTDGATMRAALRAVLPADPEAVEAIRAELVRRHMAHP